MTVLVVGTAGYIGSHMVDMLKAIQIRCLVLDNFSTGFKEAIRGVPFVEGDLADLDCLSELFNDYDIDAVMHFAAYSQVGESLIEPAKYYRNNLSNTQNLLDTMLEAGVKNLVFSSTAAVYGSPNSDPISEDHLLNPINPYGRTKLVIEWMLQDYASAYGLKSVALS
jgi:UDP-glucose 4-epimerase